MNNYYESRIYKDMLKAIDLIESRWEAIEPPCEIPKKFHLDFDNVESNFEYNDDELTKWDRLQSIPPTK